MAVLVYDDVAVKEPALLEPGGKPLGPVMLLEDHSLCPIMDVCLLFDKNIRDYSRQSNNFTTYGGVRVYNGGLQLDGTDDYLLGGNGAPAFIANPTNEIYLIQFKTSSSSRQGFFYTADWDKSTGAYDRQFGIGNSGGLWARWYSQNATTGAFGGDLPTDVTDGKTHTVCFYVDKPANKYTVYLDGREEGSASSSQNGYDGYGNNFIHIGGAQRINSDTAFHYFQGEIFLFVRAAGSLPYSLLQDLSKDPYQFLIPA